MGISKITRNFQVTLPRDVRKQKNLHVGDEVLFVVENNKIELVKLQDDVLHKAAGLWKDMKETGIAYERRMRSQWRKFS